MNYSLTQRKIRNAFTDFVTVDRSVMDKVFDCPLTGLGLGYWHGCVPLTTVQVRWLGPGAARSTPPVPTDSQPPLTVQY